MFIGDVALGNKTIGSQNHDFNVFSEILDFHFYFEFTIDWEENQQFHIELKTSSDMNIPTSFF